ncbi:MAG: hypothetical protein ACK4K9_11305 [Bacteroidia bacterium]
MLVEKYNKQKREVLTTYYHQNGAIELKGVAECINNNETFIYQWKGEWLKHDSTGKLIEVNTYRKGQRI